MDMGRSTTEDDSGLKDDVYIGPKNVATQCAAMHSCRNKRLLGSLWS